LVVVTLVIAKNIIQVRVDWRRRQVRVGSRAVEVVAGESGEDEIVRRIVFRIGRVIQIDHLAKGLQETGQLEGVVGRGR
jgi:hypothetical protein